MAQKPGNHQVSNLNPQTSNLKPQTSNLKSQTSNLKPQTSNFKPPIDYDISLAGNFGEPRPNHFHGGLDVRTEGREGKHIYAIGDGYVSRITMGKDGFGNAVYITHPTGHTSVYCHLKSFSPRIKAALRRYQYAHQTSEADARLTPRDVPVSQGQFIALSGNTGNSTAPHLHLEVHDTRTWNMLDPYQFLNDYIQDSVPPQAHAIMAIPLGGTFNGKSSNSQFTIHNSQLTAWGPVGFAIWADDYMQGSSNHYGIHETLLYVDGQMAFHSVVDDIPTRLNRMVNSWGYYDHWRRYHTWFMKSYKEPGNLLSCLITDDHRGVVHFTEERNYQLEYVLRDFKGNEAHYAFTVAARRPSPSSSSSPSSPFPSSSSFPPVGCAAALPQPPVLRWSRTSTVSLPGMQLVVPYGLVATDTPLQPRLHEQPAALSDAYQFADASLPLMADALLSISLARLHSSSTSLERPDPSKLYIANENGRFMGGDLSADGWLTGRVRELAGRYQVAYDAEPPVVRPLSGALLASGGQSSPARLTGSRLLLSVTDGQSGIASWTATVDDRFIVFDAIEKSSNYACELSESWLQRSGRSHRLRFEVTDNRSNTTVYETTFIY